jgi:hypothetical protein
MGVTINLRFIERLMPVGPPYTHAMTEEMDLSGEQDPTERMVEQQERARDRAADEENLREADHDGEVWTEQFDVSEALESV